MRAVPDANASSVRNIGLLQSDYHNAGRQLGNPKLP